MTRGFNLKLSDLGLNPSRVTRINMETRYNPKLTLRNQSEARIKSLVRSIDKAMVRAILDISNQVERNLALAITSSIWNSNDGLRDIYLTGELLASGNVTVSNDSLMVNYDVPYASLIYYGGYITPYGNKNSDKVYIPPRPWIAAVMNGTNGLPSIDYSGIISEAISNTI